MANKKTSKKETSAAVKKTKKSAQAEKYVQQEMDLTKTERKEKKPTLVKDIVALLVIVFAILMGVALFYEPMQWLKDFSYFIFGLLMYPAPLFLIGFFIALFYIPKSKQFWIRFAAGIFAFFALSGIFSVATDDPLFGGLLGRLNYLLFFSWLGDIGTIVVNALFVLIAAILILNFSIIEYVRIRREAKAEERARQKVIEEEKLEIERQAALLRERRKRMDQINTLKAENDAEERYLDEKEKEKESLVSRYEKVYHGIGDTVVSTDPDVDDDFRPEIEKERQEELFGTSEDSIPAAPAPENLYKALVLTDELEEDTEPEEPFQPEYERVTVQKKPAKKSSMKDYKFPPLARMSKGNTLTIEEKQTRQKEIADTSGNLTQVLRTFGIGVTVTNVTVGPSATRYELQPELGVKISRILNLQDDIKMALAASDIRIEAPIPGKSAIGIEVPNKVKQGIVLRDLLESDTFRKQKSKLSFPLGRDIDGNVVCCDVEKMPHMLIAGTTGSGKSVCINTLLITLLYHAKPTEVRMILIDPKVVELSVYNGIPHLMLPVVTNPKKAAMALSWACTEMDRRYETFAKYEVRDIHSFNEYVEMEAPETEDGTPVHKMQQIVIVVDEFADLMMVAAKEVEDVVCRLAQKARAAGIHLVLATQSPRSDVITGLIKANIPSRIALTVASALESRIILDMNGAERLLGRGDMLYAPVGTGKPVRVQGCYVSDSEIREVINCVKEQTNVKGGGMDESIDLSAAAASNGSSAGGRGEGAVDELFEACGKAVIESQKASIGFLQRKFGIGFNRAARIMDQLCDAGVVGPEEGTKARRILMNSVQFEERKR